MTSNIGKATILEALQEGKVTLEGQFLHSSNFTFLGNVEYLNSSFPVVYKPVRGERPLWDFPKGTLAKREVAAFLVSEALQWDMVPPTVFRRVENLGPGSLQQFIIHNPQENYFNFSGEPGLDIERIILFDAMINNADRKASHILRGQDNHFWLIDHGICFHSEDKLRTVIWDHAGQPIPTDLMLNLQSLLDGKNLISSLSEKLLNYLSINEIKALSRRALRLLNTGCFPEPDIDYRPYPWPPV